MAVKNSLTNVNDKVVEYEAAGQTVRLTPNIIRNYLVSGTSPVTDQEVVMFLNLCKYQKLNPFLREAYLIKYGSQPATMVVGKEALIKRAMHNADYRGHSAGVVVQNENGELENRTGGIVLPKEKLVGGWAKVWIRDFTVPIEAAVLFDEYAGTTKDGKLNGQWAKRPATMIRKVALVQALREAFPDDLNGMYTAEEAGTSEEELPKGEVEVEIVETAEPEIEGQ